MEDSQLLFVSIIFILMMFLGLNFLHSSQPSNQLSNRSMSAIDNSLYASNLWQQHTEQNRHTVYFDNFDQNGRGERNWALEPNVQNWSTNNSGIYEVTRYPGVSPNLRDLEQAWNLYNEVYAAVGRNDWVNYSEAKQDNFTFKSDSLHRGNRKYLFDNKTFDPEKPEYLMYYNQSGEMKLVGIMFLANNITDKPPSSYGGSLTLWHYHRYSRWKPCFERNVLIREVDECEWKRHYRTPEMIHVWLVEHPFTQFGSRMYLPENVVNYEQLDKLSKTEFINQELSEGWYVPETDLGS